MTTTRRTTDGLTSAKAFAMGEEVILCTLVEEVEERGGVCRPCSARHYLQGRLSVAESSEALFQNKEERRKTV